jgi:hypothetical protein
LIEPEKPAGEVRGLGLVNWSDCIGTGVRGVQRAFYDTKLDNSFICLFFMLLLAGGATTMAGLVFGRFATNVTGFGGAFSGGTGFPTTTMHTAIITTTTVAIIAPSLFFVTITGYLGVRPMMIGFYFWNVR